MARTVIPIAELRVGTTLPTSLYDVNQKNVMLLKEELVLSQDNLTRLINRGIQAVSVDSRYASAIWAKKSRDPRPQTSTVQQKQHVGEAAPLSAKLRKPTEPRYCETRAAYVKSHHQYHQMICDAYLEKLQISDNLLVEPIYRVSSDTINMILEDIDLFVSSVLDLRHLQHPSTHTCGVAKLAMSIATTMNYPEYEISQLGIGCLTSRAGFTPELERLLIQPREFSTIEKLEIRKHASRTLHILEKVRDMSSMARQIASQVNERWDGSGYPFGKSGNRIHPLARIAAVADVFVSLTSDLPHHSRLSPYEANVQIIRETQHGLFEPIATRGLLKCICLYPLGSHVRLTNGIIGQVIRNDFEAYDRPLLTVVIDPANQREPGDSVDLKEENQLQIREILDENQLPELMETKQNQAEPPEPKRDFPVDVSVSQ